MSRGVDSKGMPSPSKFAKGFCQESLPRQALNKPQSRRQCVWSSGSTSGAPAPCAGYQGHCPMVHQLSEESVIMLRARPVPACVSHSSNTSLGLLGQQILDPWRLPVTHAQRGLDYRNTRLTSYSESQKLFSRVGTQDVHRLQGFQPVRSGTSAALQSRAMSQSPEVLWLNLLTVCFCSDQRTGMARTLTQKRPNQDALGDEG
jgi:hypothetical protein